MARINSVSVGRAAKKLGNMVYYTMNGKTYARARVEQVKNPKTAKQMAQRVIFTTAVRSRDALKSIVDHSFENKKYGSESLNYFMKRNLEILRARAAADNGTIGAFNVPYGITMQANPLLVSQGTLPSIDYTFSENGLSIKVGSGNSISVGAFLAANPTLRKGDQISVLLLVPTHNYEATTASGEAVDATRLIKMRITIPANIADDAVFFDAEEAEFGNLLIVEGFENFGTGRTGEFLYFQDTNGTEIGNCGCVIVSRPEGKKWLRSTEYMKMNPNYDDALYYFNDVLNTWMQGTTEIAGLEDNEYLNQGQQASVENTYSVQTRSFNMTNAETGVISGVSLAALDTVTANGSKSSQIIYTQNAQQAIAGKITCYKQGSAANTLVADTTEYNKPSNAAAIIKFADANKLLGGILSIVNEWRGKTNTTTAEYELQQETGVDDYVRHITGYQGPGSFEMPALLVAIGTDNKAHFVVNDGKAVADDRTPAEYGVAYGTGSMNYSPLDTWRLSELKNYCNVVGNDSGTEFAIGDEITLETYNRITQEFEILGYVW